MKTCDSCREYLGGGSCNLSMEMECRDGGFEAWEEGEKHMEMNTYQALAQRTANTKTPSGKIENGCLGLAGETGEVCDLLKK